MKSKWLLLFFMIILLFTPLSLATTPVLISQLPDIDSTNLIGSDLSVIMKMASNYSDINLSTVKVYFNITRNGIINTAYLNGSLIQLGGATVGYPYSTTDGTNHTFKLPADVIYPITGNILDANSSNSCSVYCHKGADYSTVIQPTNTNNIFKTRLFNISNATQYNYFEAMVNVTTTVGQSPALVYFCNASYSTGAMTTSPNCGQIGSFIPKTTFDHYHSNNPTTGTLAHSVIPYSVDTTNGTIAGIKVSPSDNYFAIKFQSTGWNIYYSNNITRTDQTRRTINNGALWNNFAGTLRWHVHKFNANDIFSYYTCYNSTSTGTRYCSSVVQDTIGLASQPPIGGSFTNPNGINTFLNNTNMTPTWNAGYSLTDGVIIGYNLSVWQNGVKIMDIGNYSASTLNATFNTSLLGVGSYNFRLITNSNKSLNTTASSVIFTIYDFSSVSGYVTNTLGLPIQNVRVDLTNMGTLHTLFTDVNGYYTNHDTISGISTMLVRAIGYQNTTISHDHNASYWQNFTLSEKTIPVKLPSLSVFSTIGILILSFIYCRMKRGNHGL